MRRITAGSVMKAMIFIFSPHCRQVKGAKVPHSAFVVNARSPEVILCNIHSAP